MTIKIKLEEDRENKVKGFYLLMTNGNTYSDKKDEFVVKEELLKILDDNGIKYERMEKGK